MWIIAIDEDSYSGGEALAVTLAHRLHCLYVTPMELVATANTCGVDPDEVKNMFENPPDLLQRLLAHISPGLSALRGILAQTIQNRDTVCYGAIADLLPDAPEVIRIRVHASYESRLRTLQNVKKLDGNEAKKYLNENDLRHERWCTYVGGSAQAELDVNLDDTELEKAWEIIEDLIAKAGAEMDGISPALERFVLGTSKTRGLIAEQLARCTKRARPWLRPAPALVVMVLSSLLLMKTPWTKGNRQPLSNMPLENIAGTITDTICAGEPHVHEQSAECVRSCMRQPGAKYALDTGTKVYPISDQAAAARFAAHNVIAQGSIDPRTGVLLISSIQSR